MFLFLKTHVGLAATVMLAGVSSAQMPTDAPPPLPEAIVINEFHYDPADRTVPEEFIELHNAGDAVIDLGGWTLSDAVTFTFPPGTELPPGGFLVVAESPPTILARYGKSALGPWSGNLNSQGERIDLRDATGVLRDRVEYGVGFPWPTAADGAGNSAELLHPSLDNDLGGSWRSSGAVAVPPATYVTQNASGWRYRKGTAEASSPADAWRATSFNDSSWSTGTAGFGYGYTTGHNTTFSDMRRVTALGVPGYSSVYFRKAFTVPASSIPRQLRLQVRIDDGCIIWINGREVARRYVASGELAFNALATNHTRVWEELLINDADTFLLGGTNVIAVHGFNTSLTSSDFSFDLELSNLSTAATSPSPGVANSTLLPTNTIPPQIRQVAHSPTSPPPGVPVTITARLTDPDGMGPVTLAYQLVDPGAYIRRTDAAYATSWTSLPMMDDGTHGDAIAGDSTFTVVLPAALQAHRRLVRYRITFADTLGNSQTVPYADDEQPNFAYFVYGGVPAWTGAMRPSSFNGFPATPAQTYPAALMERLPPLHLIADATDVANCQYNSSFNSTRFRGTVVERGVVHDHIEFRVRGIGSTYQSGKNKWNLYFNRARDYQGYDNYGNPYREKWNNLLINANASPWAPVHRGSGGVEEALSHRLYQLAGMAAMNTRYIHFRVIDEAAESAVGDQYSGDLWGLYLGLEPTEGAFLRERGLDSGNLYSIEGNAGDKKHQGSSHPVDSSDWSAFASALEQSGQTEAWYRANVDLPTLYTFLAINRLIGNVDVRPGDNYRFYRRPSDNRWVIIPYDLDMQFIAAHHWGGTMDTVTVAGAPNVIRAISRHPNLARDYRNRCRELLSLLAADGKSNGGQIGQLVAETAHFIHTPGESLTWANLDAAMWNLHPRTNGNGANSGQGSHKGNFFRATYLDGSRGGLGGTVSTTSWIRRLADPDADGFSNHEGLMQWFVNYATNTWPGGTWNRKAMTGIGDGIDSDPARQSGYGYQYLRFESLHGGWIHGNANPPAPPVIDFPQKPMATAVGDPAFSVNDLRFTSSRFADPQGAADFAAVQWRIARLSAPGLPGHDPALPWEYEISHAWTSPEITTAPGEFAFPLDVARAGAAHRVRVRHKDLAGNWSEWSDPVRFTTTAAAPQELIHYWNFNGAITYLLPSFTAGGAVLATTATPPAEVLRHDSQDQGFTGENARNGDPAGAHLRVNNPLGAGLDFRLPTKGFENIIVRYETRRSGQGAGIQRIFHTLDGLTYLPFEEIVVEDAGPVVRVLDFRNLAGAGDNPNFGLRILFAQGAGDVAGNHRMDNFTVEGDALPGGYQLWQAAHFADPIEDSIAGPLAAPAGDGVANLIRYALGLGPYDSVAARLPRLVMTPAGPALWFHHDTTKSDLRWRVTSSPDLVDWSVVRHDSLADGPPPANPDAWFNAAVPLPEAARLFHRLEITLDSQ